MSGETLLLFDDAGNPVCSVGCGNRVKESGDVCAACWPPPAVTGEGMRDDGSEDCDCAEIDAKEVLCRVFDDIDEAYAEWDAFDQTGWFSRARALGAFIRTRQDRLRASDTADGRLRAPAGLGVDQE